MFNGKKAYGFIRLALTASCAALILCACAGNTDSAKTPADASVATRTEAGKASAQDTEKGSGAKNPGDSGEKKAARSSGDRQMHSVRRKSISATMHSPPKA